MPWSTWLAPLRRAADIACIPAAPVTMPAEGVELRVLGGVAARDARAADSGGGGPKRGRQGRKPAWTGAHSPSEGLGLVACPARISPILTSHVFSPVLYVIGAAAPRTPTNFIKKKKLKGPTYSNKHTPDGWDQIP